MPAGWVPPFWLAAAYAGCKPAGQREWRWLAALQGRCCFPWDHPDTAGHAALMARQLLQRQLALAKRPKAKQMLAAPPCPPDWHAVLQQGRSGPQAAPPAQQQQEAAPQEQQAAAQLAVEQPAASMDVDATSDAAQKQQQRAQQQQQQQQQQLFVARSYAAMAAALYASSGDARRLPSGGSPTAAAVQQGRLEWRPRQPDSSAAVHPEAASGGSEPGSRLPCCVLEAAVQPIKTGVAAEGAAICFIAGREGEWHRTPVDMLSARQQRRRQREAEQQRAALREAGGDPAEAAALGAVAAGGRAEVGEDEVRVIGYVLSEAPRGAPRRCGAMAAVAAGPAWRLRSLQHEGARQGGGAIEAFVRNPDSATLFPVWLRLLLEPRPPL